MNNHFIEFKNITKKFPRVIANNKVSFNINKSTVHALLGENGAGKSTLVKVLYGLLEPEEGHINFNNEIQFEFLNNTNNRIFINEYGVKTEDGQIIKNNL